MPFGIALSVAACASVSPPTPSVVVLPGRGKDAAVFRQDDLVCRRHAVAHTAYGGPAPTNPPIGAVDPAAEPPVPSEADPTDEIGYAQCMAARGNMVRAEPSAYAASTLWYSYG